MTRNALTLAFLAAALALAAGSGILTGGSSDEQAQIAQERCDRLLENYCDKVEDCSWFTSKEECLTESRQTIDCGDAVDTSDDYDRCLQDIEFIDCGATPGLPASCNGVIIVES